MTTLRGLAGRVLGMRGTLAIGFLDSALASLATFTIGLYATRFFTPDELGAYAVFFGAFLLVIMVPAELIYRPTEVETVTHDRIRRLGVLGRSLAVGAGPSAAVAIAFSAAALLVPVDVGTETRLALALTAGCAGFLSPAQDHVRRMFHQAGRSGFAAAMSATQLVVVVAALAVLDRVDVDVGWIPLGALAVANLISLGAGLVAAAVVHGGGSIPLDVRGLYRTGGWLVVSGFALVGGQVAGIVLTTILAGSDAAGIAQASLILAQPLLVLATGLGSVLNPDIMEAARAGNESASRSLSRLYASLMVVATIGMALLVGIEWSLNPLPDVFPNAYTASGLLALTIIVQGANYTLFGNRYELIGGLAHVPMAKASVIASVAQVGVGFAAPVLAAYTVASGIGSAVVVKAALYRRALRRMYAASGGARPGPSGERPR